jgi:hypothetical protein
MTPEGVLSRMLPAVETLLKSVVAQAMATATAPTLYELEALTQRILPQIGQVLLQELTRAQGSGLVGPTRPCGCGAEQHDRDAGRPLVVQTSVGDIHLEQRAFYRCAGCAATSYPLDARLGLGQAGRMSRYLQEQCAWLLALLPGRVGQQTLARFGWPAVVPSQVREKGQALGAEMDACEQQRLAELQAAVGQPQSTLVPRQPAQGTRLYAAPDALRYCTTEQDPQTRKLVWRELKAAVIYEVASPADTPPAPSPRQTGPEERPAVRQRVQEWAASQTPGWTLAPVDQAVRVTYVARTEPYARFGEVLWKELVERGLGTTVTDLAVLADGSGHLSQVVDTHLRLPDLRVTQILDLPHGQQHLWALSKVAFGDGASAGVRWVQEPLRLLERGQVEQLCARIAAVPTAPAAHPAVAEEAAKTAAFFTDRAAQVAYPSFLAAGYQIGSGLAESACKRFGTDRMKGAGMRWTVPGAQCVATLRMLLLSDRWDEVSAHCRSHEAA